jgi:uncharacterized protein YuzE
VRVELDRGADAAYIYLTRIESGGVARSHNIDPREVGTMINLDFDNDGRLLGIEVLDASRYLPKDLLDSAQVIG